MPVGSLLLEDLGPNVHLNAEQDGLWLQYSGSDERICLQRSDRWPEFEGDSPRVRTWRTVVEQLVDQDLAIPEGQHVKIPYENLDSIEDQGLTLFSEITRWSPFSIHVRSHSIFGAPDFRYITQLKLGTRVFTPIRLGCFLLIGETVYRLPRTTFCLLNAIDSFNALQPDQKTTATSLKEFASIKTLIQESDAEADPLLSTTHVVLPSKVALDVEFDEEGRASLFPLFDGIPRNAFKEVFFQLSDVDTVYVLPSSDGGRIRVVLHEDIRKALRVIQTIRHVGGTAKSQVLGNPASLFEGVCDLDLIDVSLYGPRVRGIGKYPARVSPYVRKDGKRLFSKDEDSEVGLVYEFSDGKSQEVKFDSQDDLRNFAERIATAHAAGESFVGFKDASVPVTDSLVRAVTSLVKRFDTARERRVPMPSSSANLLIYANVDILEYDEASQAIPGTTGPELPKSITHGDTLMPHQAEGIAWLQHLYRHNSIRRGGLLADEMGLGKTLQVLAFIAADLESAPPTHSGLASGQGPVLIIAPLMLLPTWEEEMRRHFRNHGEIFEPLLVLHGGTLNQFRCGTGSLRESQAQGSVLDLDRIQAHRVVLTNYETVRNYQYSLARIRWRMVITDESQEFKDGSTSISYAVKALYPRFRVALTGTPVENRLSDIWNIMDFVQPGVLLGSYRDFVKTYEQPAMTGTSDERLQHLQALRDRLRYREPDAFLLRREKKLLSGLPVKHPPHVLEANLMPEQRLLHLECMARMRNPGLEEHRFRLLDRLAKLSQHPFLLDKTQRLEIKEPRDYVQASPKLQTVIRTLHMISEKREKAILFTRSRPMQDILKLVLEHEFKLTVGVINGSPESSRRYIVKDRANRIKDFESLPGFNVLILSPDVAGVGLTINAANHVIHYGRWWNPAREAQATDRVYRIGQKLDVHVYLPIERDPKGEFHTFDQCLHDLLLSKQRDACDFLIPLPSEENLEAELFENLQQQHQEPTGKLRPIQNKADLQFLMPEMFEALVARLFLKEGSQVILTPVTGDRGVDFIAVSPRAVTLVECKHSAVGSPLDAEVIDHFVNGVEYYVHNILPPSLLNRPRECLLVTNTSFDRHLLASAKAHDISVLANSDLTTRLRQVPITCLDVEEQNGGRQRSMNQVRAALRTLR
jgi:SNF2 family DNA or RNA helicase